MARWAKQPHLAVIMPAYNAETFLPQAIDSILAQSWSNFSLFIIDDGSTDSTAQIVASYADADARVHSITIPNGGPAKARNIGLELAESISDYILFCDADDEYLPDAFSSFMETAAPDSDIVIGGFTIINPDGSQNHYYEPAQHLASDQFGQELSSLYKANLLNQVWGKLFRSRLIAENQIRFPDYRWGEDRLFMFRCLECSNCIDVFPACNYLYKMHTTTSLITGFYAKKVDICVLVDEYARSLCRKFHVFDDSWFRTMFLKSIFSCISTLYSPSCTLSRKEKREYVRRILCNPNIMSRIEGVSGGMFAKILSFLLRTRSVVLTLAAARLSVFLSAAMPKLFQKIKHKK